MTGSRSALIVIPIVALISLALLLIIVFYADSQLERGRGTPNREHIWNQIHWWMLGPCLGAVVVGLLLLAFPINEVTKYFVSGALVGIGAGGGIAEISGAFERFELRERMEQLREPVLARCRLAYRIGEFFFPFYAAVSKRQYDDRHIKEVLFLGELLGMRSSLESTIRDANPDDPKLHELLMYRIKEAMTYAGEHLLLFFELGTDMLAMRGSDAKKDSDARVIVASRIEANLNRARGFTDDPSVEGGWVHFIAFWNRGLLVSSEIDNLLLSFHAFLLVLGLEYEGYLPWKAIIDDLAKLDVGKTDRPPGLARVLDAIQRARS